MPWKCPAQPPGTALTFRRLQPLWGDEMTETRYWCCRFQRERREFRRRGWVETWKFLASRKL